MEVVITHSRRDNYLYCVEYHRNNQTIPYIFIENSKMLQLICILILLLEKSKLRVMQF